MEGVPIFFKKPEFYNFMKTCSSFPILCRIWYYVSLGLPNSYVLKWQGGAVSKNNGEGGDVEIVAAVTRDGTLT